MTERTRLQHGPISTEPETPPQEFHGQIVRGVFLNDFFGDFKMRVNYQTHEATRTVTFILDNFDPKILGQIQNGREIIVTGRETVKPRRKSGGTKNEKKILAERIEFPKLLIFF